MGGTGQRHQLHGGIFQLVRNDLGHGKVSLRLYALSHIHNHLTCTNMRCGLSCSGTDEHRGYCKQQHILIRTNLGNILGEAQLLGDHHTGQIGVRMAGRHIINFFFNGRPYRYLMTNIAKHPGKGHAPGTGA